MIWRRMKILVVGHGAREHALYWAIGYGHPERRVLIAPGNGGIPVADRRNVKDSDLAGIVQLAKDRNVDLVVVGPEAPLVAGLVDLLQQNGICGFGPNTTGAQLEGSKIFTKQFCDEFGIPTAPWAWTDNMNQAHRLIDVRAAQSVIKADGLCGGKGVVVSGGRKQSRAVAAAMLVAKIHGEAGSRIIIEDRLDGRECSVMAFCDGENAVPLPPARDYKRAFDGDIGLNTGGMGAYSPLPDVDDDLLAEIVTTIIMPTLRGMKVHGTPYYGVLYAGIMLTADGPKLLEYNVRFGDPETQVVLPRIESDIIEYVLACTKSGGLAELPPLKVKREAAVCVNFVSGGYPGSYETGFPIYGLENVPPDVLVSHAGTKWVDGQLVTDGGRVLSLTGQGPTIVDACRRVYAAAKLISFRGMTYRRDIGE